MPKTTKDPVFGMSICWSCGAPHKAGGDFTVGCPGCDARVPYSEKMGDIDTQEILHPELRDYAAVDEALISDALKVLEVEGSLDDVLLAAMERSKNNEANKQSE